MDAELREALKDLNSSIRESSRELHAKIDNIQEGMKNHAIEGAARCASHEAMMDTTRSLLDDHINDHKEAKKWWLALWGGVIGNALMGVWAWIRSH